jgi:ribosomal protein L40E
MENFYNSGFGWICRKCEASLKLDSATETIGRLMREGESESKNPRFSTAAMAKWKDKEQSALICPRCEASEAVS